MRGAVLAWRALQALAGKLTIAGTLELLTLDTLSTLVSLILLADSVETLHRKDSRSFSWGGWLEGGFGARAL